MWVFFVYAALNFLSHRRSTEDMEANPGAVQRVIEDSKCFAVDFLVAAQNCARNRDSLSALERACMVFNLFQLHHMFEHVLYQDIFLYFETDAWETLSDLQKDTGAS
jgi:hypothetical protein